MADNETIQALLEENLELSRETHTKVSGLEIQVRALVDKVERHDVSLYHADDGGLVGRIARVEDRLKAEIKSVADAASANTKRIEDRVMLVWGAFALIGGGVATWIMGQLLGLINP